MALVSSRKMVPVNELDVCHSYFITYLFTLLYITIVNILPIFLVYYAYSIDEIVSFP